MKKFATSALALFLCLTLVACSSWVAQMSNIIKVLTPATLAIVQMSALQAGHPVNDAEIGLINTELGNVVTLLTDLSSVNAPPGTLEKLQAALQLVQRDIVPLLELARVHNGDNATSIGVMIDLAINEINAIISLAHPTSPTARSVKTRAPLSANQLKKQFDAQLTKMGQKPLTVK